MEQELLTFYGSPGCSGSRWSRKYLDENGIAYRWVDVNRDAEGLRRVREINAGRRTVPTIVFEDGSVLVEPSNSQLGLRLGIEPEPRGLKLVPASLSRLLPRRWGPSTVPSEKGEST